MLSDKESRNILTSSCQTELVVNQSCFTSYYISDNTQITLLFSSSFSWESGFHHSFLMIKASGSYLMSNKYRTTG